MGWVLLIFSEGGQVVLTVAIHYGGKQDLYNTELNVPIHTRLNG